MTKGVIQDWGLVEFFDSNDTELTQVELQDYKLFKDGLPYSIRVHFCIPGVNAIHLHMKVNIDHFRELISFLMHVTNAKLTTL